MIITDAQVHIWLQDSPERPWAPEGKMYKQTFKGPDAPDSCLPEDMIALMDEAGVARAVLVPPSFEGDRNDLALRAVEQFPDRFAVMGRIALDDPNSPSALERWPDLPGMRGARFTFHRGPSMTWLSDGTADWFWAAAERLGLAVYLYPPGQLDEVARIAAAHTNLRLTIDHLGLDTESKDDDVLPHIKELVGLARFPNVAVKASGLTGNSAEPYPFPKLHEPIERVVDAFGPHRTFWGSDVTRVPYSYQQAIKLFTEELDFLSDADLEWIMGRGVSEWLRWPA